MPTMPIRLRSDRTIFFGGSCPNSPTLFVPHRTAVMAAVAMAPPNRPTAMARTSPGCLVGGARSADFRRRVVGAIPPLPLELETNFLSICLLGEAPGDDRTAPPDTEVCRDGSRV